MNETNYLNQTQLAERWQVAESTLERWRSEGIGPIYMKMMGRVRYRLSDITDFEEDSICGDTWTAGLCGCDTTKDSICSIRDFHRVIGKADQRVVKDFNCV